MINILKSKLNNLFIPIIVIFVAFLISAILLLILGFDPGITFLTMFKAAFGSIDGFSNTLRWSATLILLGLSVSFSFKVGEFNLGAQGQLWMGAFAAVWVAISFPNLPTVISLLLAFLLAMLVGGVWSAIPGLFRVWLGPRANVIISTLMMNYIAYLLTNYLVRVPYNVDPGGDAKVMATKSIRDTLALPSLVDNLIGFSIIAAILFSIIAMWFFGRHKLGYEINLVGKNPWFAETSGINVRGTILRAMIVSGAIAGFAGACEVLGPIGRFVSNFSPDLGFNGVTIAVIANSHPLGIVVTGLFFGALKAGSLAVRIATDTPRAIVSTLEGLIVFLITARLFYSLIKKGKKSSIG